MKIFTYFKRIAGLSLIILHSSVFAHPLDISSSTFSVGQRTIEAVTYLHPSQVEAIIGARGVSQRSLTYWDYYKYSNFLSDYIRTKVQIKDQDGKLCTTENFSTQDLWVDEIFTKGFPVSYQVRCVGSLSKITYDVSIFRELPLQTNRVLLVDGPSGNPLWYKVLTANITSAEFDPASPRKLTDTDGDKLPDEEERVYRTDSTKTDTDGDNYSDYEEVMSGWDPLKKSRSPGQVVRDKPSDAEFVLPTGILQTAGGAPTRTTDRGSLDNTSIAPDSSKLTEKLNTTSYSLFRNVLSWLESLRKDGTLSLWAIILGLWTLFLLGALHAIGPGHSKWFMASYILTTDAGYTRGILYAGIFTIVHLLDIVVLVLITKFLFNAFDPTMYLSTLSKWAAILLVLISIGIFAYSARKLLRAKAQSHTPLQTNNSWNLRAGLSMAFLSGLAPCTFAWSLLLVLFAINRFDLALPVIGAFGLGVFVSLAAVSIVVVRFRSSVVDRFRWSVYYFPIFSSIILFALAVFLALQVW